MLIIRNNHRGFSVVELLVAMGLSLILLAGVATMFAGSRGSYETNDRLARLEENGRFALDTIARDIRSAGYLGCSNATSINLVVNNPGNVFGNLGTIPVQGFNSVGAGTWSPALPAFITTPADGSDVLLISGPTAAPSVAITAPMAAKTDDLVVTPVASGSGFFKTNQLVMIGDCNSRSYFEVSGYAPSTGHVQHAAGSGGAGFYGNSSGAFASAYGSIDATSGEATNATAGSAQIFGVQTEVFYVAPATASTVANPYNSLWRQIEGNPTPDELIEGVDSMRLLYGLDTLGATAPDGSLIVDTYATTAPTPSQIVNVTVSLLIRSINEYGSLVNTNTYKLLGTAYPAANFTVSPGDRRQRQVFSTTIWVRNPPPSP